MIFKASQQNLWRLCLWLQSLGAFRHGRRADGAKHDLMGIAECAIALRLMAGQQMGNASANHHKTDRRLGGEVAGTFNHGARLGRGVAEWAHPQKQLGNALAHDNHLSLSRKLPSPAITNTRYREKCPRPR